MFVVLRSVLIKRFAPIESFIPIEGINGYSTEMALSFWMGICSVDTYADF
jgi:hypothetical protein